MGSRAVRAWVREPGHEWEAVRFTLNVGDQRLECVYPLSGEFIGDDPSAVLPVVGHVVLHDFVQALVEFGLIVGSRKGGEFVEQGA